MRAILLAAVLAAVLTAAGCQLDEPTLGGTVVSVMEAERGEDADSVEQSGKHYEDPLVPEVGWQVEVRLDDGAEVTVITNGPRRYGPGERVRVLKDESGGLLL